MNQSYLVLLCECVRLRINQLIAYLDAASLICAWHAAMRLRCLSQHILPHRRCLNSESRRAIVAGEENQRFLSQVQPIQLGHQFAHQFVHVLDVIAIQLILVRAGPDNAAVITILTL